MMRITLLVAGWLLFHVLPVTGSGSFGEIGIKGRAPGYGGEEIVFYGWTDNISFTEEEVFRFRVDDDDRFSASFRTSENPRYVFSDIGIYYMYMYIEPGMEYHIVLPEKTERSAWEKLNPYFEGTPTHIAVINHDSTELNALISNFDRIYEPLFGENLIRLNIDRDHELLDSIHAIFDGMFPGSIHPYFDAYKRYKLALLDIMAQRSSARAISDKYFRSEPVLYHNVAYMELFNQVYNKYLLFFSRTPRGSRIFDDINRDRSLASLLNTLQTDMVLGGDRLLEMVILKGLHDAFYESDFSRSGLLAVLDSLAATTVFPEHVLISGHIREKVTRLVAGFKPPAFELRNRDGEMAGLHDFLGYYVYLNFCTAASYSCLSDYKLLSWMQDRHREYLKIVTVFIDESYEAMLEFLGKNDYDWDFLFYGNQPSVLKDYDVRIFPYYYLLDRDGTLLMSPAPRPAEDFERYLLRTMQSRGEIK